MCKNEYTCQIEKKYYCKVSIKLNTSLRSFGKKKKKTFGGKIFNQVMTSVISGFAFSIGILIG